MRNRTVWIVVSGTLAVIAALSIWCRHSSELAFLYDLGPNAVKVSDSKVSPNRRNETTSFAFPEEKASLVIGGLRKFAARKRFALHDGFGIPDVGSITGDPNGIYIISWKPNQYEEGSAWTAPAQRGDFTVAIFRNESTLEVKLHDLKSFLHLD
jgi:hypothetical protein